MFQLISKDKYDFKEYDFMNFKTFLFALSFPVFFSFSQLTFSQTHVSSDQLTEAIKEARLTNPELRVTAHSRKFLFKAIEMASKEEYPLFLIVLT